MKVRGADMLVPSQGKSKDEDGDVRMGYDDSAMHYDEEHIFKHL